MSFAGVFKPVIQSRAKYSTNNVFTYQQLSYFAGLNLAEVECVVLEGRTAHDHAPLRHETLTQDVA